MENTSFAEYTRYFIITNTLVPTISRKLPKIAENPEAIALLTEISFVLSLIVVK